MEKIAIIYKSKYGTAKKYAVWIADETKGKLIENSKINAGLLYDYNKIVYCGGLYAGGILGFSLIKNNYDMLKNKKIAVVAVGSSTHKEKAEAEVKNRNFTDDMKNSNVQLFFVRGGLDYKKMNMLDRLLMFLLKKSCEKKKPEERDDDAKGIIASYGKTVDFTNKNDVLPIIDFIEK